LLSNVYGGLANGFFSTSTVVIPGTTTILNVNTARTQNYDPTVGIRIRFWPGEPVRATEDRQSWLPSIQPLLQSFGSSLNPSSSPLPSG
jgi:hypothetical protein